MASIIKKSVSRIRNEEFLPDIGDHVNLWNKPETKQINIYSIGSSGGNGLLGSFISRKVSKHLRQDKLCHAIINSYDENYIQVKIELLNKTQSDLSLEKEEHLKKKFLKSYTPRSDWDLIFKMTEEFDPNLQVKIGFQELDSFLKSGGSVHDALWVEDMNGNQLNKKSYLDHNNATKTLKALYNGHECRVKKIEKNDDDFKFTIGI